MKLFGRQYKLTVGNESESLEIKHLRIYVESVMTLTSGPNPAKGALYELSQQTIDRITSGEFKYCTFEAGYEELGLIFMGDIRKAIVKKDGVDLILSLEVYDGFNAINLSSVSTTLKAGSTDKDIIDGLINNMELDINSAFVDAGNERQLTRAKVINGNVKKYLGQIGANQNADWSVQDGQFFMLSKDKVTNSAGYLINERTGMVGTPQKSDNGIELITLLQPEILVGSLIRVESVVNQYNGDFKVTDIKLSGDTHSEKWYSQITAIGGEFQRAKQK
mgnify:CR=1 FL=1